MRGVGEGTVFIIILITNNWLNCLCVGGEAMALGYWNGGLIVAISIPESKPQG